MKKVTSLLFLTMLVTIIYFFSKGADEYILKDNIIPLSPTEHRQVNVRAYGANGDGITDDTEAIQNALNSNLNVFIPDGVYLINVERSLRPRSNQTITMSENTVLKAIPTSREYFSVIRINNVSNVSISGGRIIGERHEHIGETGEWGMGIHIINGARNISINNIMISDCWGDGIYLGGRSYVSDISIDNVISDNNRRQGISIVNAKNVTISNSVFKNTNGTAPQAGINIEPNPGQIAKNIKIINTESLDNNGVGIDFMGINEMIRNVEVINSTVKNNGTGIRIIGAIDLTFTNVKSNNNYFFGIEIPRNVSNISFKNMVISENQSRGISIVSTRQTEGIENIIFENTIVSNNSIRRPGAADGVRIDNYDSSGHIRNIKFKNSKFVDNQKNKTQRFGISVGFSNNIHQIVVDSNSIIEGNMIGGLLANPRIVRRELRI